MAPSDSRPPFRLPWQTGHASEPGSEMAAPTATIEVPAWPSHDLVRRDSRTDDVATTSAAADTASPTVDAPELSGTTTTDWTTEATSDATPVAEMTTAEMTTAEPSAQTTTAEPTHWTTGEPTGETTHDTGTAETEMATAEAATPATHGTTDMPADLRGRKPTKFLADLTRAMRQAADEARQSALTQFQADVTRHIEASRSEADAAAGEARRRADDDVASLREWSKAEIARIKQETEDKTAARRTHLEAELAGQTARLEHELECVQERVQAFEAEMESFFQRLGQEDDPSAFAGVAEQLPEPPAFEAWHAMTDEPASDEATDATTATDTTDTSSAAETWTTTGDSAMPQMRPDDFAAAEAEAATWQTDGPVETDRADETDATTPDHAADAGAAWPPVAASEPAASETSRTQVVLVGLVSVASIATFKRLLSRVPGVRTVQVASGPDGEFLFKTLHTSDVNMAAAVAGIQGFDVEVTESGDGIVSARAVDPEVV